MWGNGRLVKLRLGSGLDRYESPARFSDYLQVTVPKMYPICGNGVL
jgi:hypothetical protein